MDASQLGLLIKKHRELARFTHRDLAFAAGISRSTLQRIESGQIDGKVSQVASIFAALIRAGRPLYFSIGEEGAAEKVISAADIPAQVDENQMTMFEEGDEGQAEGDRVLDDDNEAAAQHARDIEDRRNGQWDDGAYDRLVQHRRTEAEKRAAIESAKDDDDIGIF